MSDLSFHMPCPHWRRSLPEAPGVCLAAAAAALEAGAAKATAGALSIVLSDDAQVRALNQRYRGQDKATNVLSFAAPPPLAGGDPTSVLGDIILAYETVQQEAAAQSKSLAAHVSHLVVHGVLHLLGYDHDTDGSAAQMEALEVLTLSRLGIADPYAEDAALASVETGHG